MKNILLLNALMGVLISVLFTGATASAEWIKLEGGRSFSKSPLKSVVKTPEGYRLQIRTEGFDYTIKNLNRQNFGRMSLSAAQEVTHESGKPQMPVIRQVVELPTGAASLRVKSSAPKTVAFSSLGYTHKLAPAQDSAAKLPGAVATFKMDSAAYQSDDLYPQAMVRIAYQGSVRGHQIAMIEIAPLQYNAVKNELVYSADITVDVIHEGSLLQLPEKAAATSFDLPANILGFDSTTTAATQSYLMIVGLGFESSAKVQELIADKEAMGFRVITRNARDLGNTPEAIRAEIRKIYLDTIQREPLSYVLLIGDTAQVATYSPYGYNQPTNNYYASIDKPTYGEDKAFPDLAVGRLTVSTAAELDVVINKIVKYDHQRFQDQSWQKKTAFVATDDKWELAEATHAYVIDSYTKPLDFTGSFPASPEVGGDKLYAVTHSAKTDNLMESINDGRVLIAYSGHGLESGWAGPNMTQANVLSLKHPEALPYVMSHACLTGSFAGNTDSFSETWLKAPHGAIAFWGTSNLSYWDEDDILERSFFDGVYKHGLKSIGQMNLYGLQGVRDFYSNGGKTAYYYEIYNLMGDPSIQLTIR